MPARRRRTVPYIAIGRARRATARRLQPGTVTPPGFADTKPAEWLLGITRNYRMLYRRGTLVFRPAPFTRVPAKSRDRGLSWAFAVR